MTALAQPLPLAAVFLIQDIEAARLIRDKRKPGSYPWKKAVRAIDRLIPNLERYSAYEANKQRAIERAY